MENIEYILWGTPKGSNDPIDEKVLYTQGKTIVDIQCIEKLAASDGWHSFRVQELNLNVAPDFSVEVKNAIVRMTKNKSK